MQIIYLQGPFLRQGRAFGCAGPTKVKRIKRTWVIKIRAAECLMVFSNLPALFFALKSMQIIRFLILICFAFPSFFVRAGGFQVALQNQRQIGMAHTGTALAFDASSIFFNPGSLAFTIRNNVLFGGSLIRSRVKYLAWQEENAPNPYQTETESPIGTPFQLYASFAFPESRFRFGLGVYTPYGSSVKWPDNWKGFSVLRSLKLQSIFIQPTLSFRISDRLAIGGGLVYATGSVELNKGVGALASADGFSSARLSGKASGIGYNIGMHARLAEGLNAGISYRSKVSMQVDRGDATFTVPSSTSGILGLFPAGGRTNFSAELPLPATLSAGLSWQADKKLLIALDYNHVYWSAYRELRFDYDAQVNGADFSASPRNYRDAGIYRIGAEYQATEKLAVRAGYYFDQTPVPDGYMTPETPDANRNGFSSGIGYRFSDHFSADASFLYVEGRTREQSPESIPASAQDSFLPGTYKIRVFIPGLTLNYQF
jgi:long-chain fatty acid transport protein